MLQVSGTMTQVPVVTDQEAEEIDRLLTTEQGLSLLDKVEVAGRALAETVRQMLAGSERGKYIIVLAGVGDNGAAGMAAVRRLHEAGAEVRLVLSARPDHLHEMAAHQYAILQKMGIEGWGLSLDQETMAQQEPIAWTSADLIVDAIFGSGLEGEPRGEAAELIRLANASRLPILAFDLPSGLCGDEGTIQSPCTDATATLTLTLPRRAHAEGWPVVGELWIADTGATSDLYERLGFHVGDLYRGRAVISLGSARKLKYP
ncbi:MAG: NAD(P)H-hydrate epimerase [Ardenticatenaceae bacterium]